MMKSKRRVIPYWIILVACFFGLCSTTYANTFDQNFQFEISVTSWISDGQTDWNHDATNVNTLVGNPTSELIYEKIKSNIVEFSITTNLAVSDIFLHLVYGSGNIDQGRLIDDDYLNASGATFYGTTLTGEHRYSRTYSDINGNDLEYFSVELGKSLITSSTKTGGLVFYLGYQFWKETYVATGVTQSECTSPGVLCNAAGYQDFIGSPVITNRVKWYAAYFGLEGAFRLNEGWMLSGNFSYSPLVLLDNEDVHHLRNDLSKQPSFSMSGNGIGYNTEIEAIYNFTSWSSLHLGYRYWFRQVENETWRSHPASGGTLVANLNKFTTRREGIVLRLDILF